MSQSRKYDKGERRFKHVGVGPKPVIEQDVDEPRKWIGKCPNNIPDTKKLELLNEAISAPSDGLPRARSRLYAVHEGAIYEAQTSDGGLTFHAYPYRGKLPKALLTELEGLAAKKGCLDAFDRWSKEHIVLHGERR